MFVGYAHELLLDAQEYQLTSGRQNITPDDIQLAIHSKMNYHFASPPPRELLLELADKCNKKPLPPIPSEYGLHLPPPEDQLSMDNIRIVNLHENNATAAGSSTAGAGAVKSAKPVEKSTNGKGSRNKSTAAKTIPVIIGKRKLSSS